VTKSIAISATFLTLLLGGACTSERPSATPTGTSTTSTANVAPTRVGNAPPTVGPDGSPPGYYSSCAAAYPWGRQVTAGFVCIEPPFGIERGAQGELSAVSVQGYAGGSFENNVVLELVEIAANGTSGPPLVRQATTYRAPDVGMPGSWSIRMPIRSGQQPPAGRLRVVAYFESPRDGARVAETTLDLP